VPPLAAIRADYQVARRVHHDPLVWLLYGLIAAGIVGLCALHSSSIQDGLVTAGGMAAAFLLLGGVARLLAAAVRRFSPKRLPYVWRQGLANLHRPQNRTVLLMLSLGLGTFLVLLLYVVQGTLLKELISTRAGDRPNLALFDIQSDQKEAVMEMIRSRGLPVLDDAPVITMRLAEIKGRPVEEILTDTNRTIPNWVLRREYRSTYSDRLRGGERLVAGKWPVNRSGEGPASISLEQGIARDLGVRIGDEIVFDVQGVPVAARIQSLREVDWRRVQPNFFVVFAPGVLNDAPATHVLVSRAESAAQSAELQRELVKAFPNVSAIDVTLILQSLDAIFSRIAFAVRFMASFTVITGLVVLGASVLTGRYQRIRESVLLRSLGASRSQIFQILLAEYSCLGLLAASAGIFLALGTGWALAHFVLHLKFAPAVLPIVIGLLLVTTLTVLTGLLASRGVLNHPPLEVLRAE
jgi:putative ABC transport system permease protein